VTEQREFWMRWRVRAGYFVAVVYWVLAEPTPRSLFWGGLIAFTGLLVRGLASGYLRKYEDLATSGPYARTRNPLYFGSALLATGFVVAGRSWWAGLIVGSYFTVFYTAVMHNEERALRSRFGRKFDEYAARVPLFFPRISKPPDRESAECAESKKRFSWEQYRRNREYNAFIGTLAGLGIVWLRAWLRVRFGY
jgi:protein-S-isoprenylcysteine O-methyltransferase Ste14